MMEVVNAMADITIKIPEDIRDFVTGTKDTIYVEAIKEVARKKILHAQRRLKEMKRKISAYETKYGKSYEEFSQTVPDTFNGHDDWIDWMYLVNTASELEHKIAKIRLLVGK